MRKTFKDLRSQFEEKLHQPNLAGQPSSAGPPSVPLATKPTSQSFAGNVGSSQGMQQQPLAQQGPLLQQPTEQEVLAYRYHHGTNIGSVFALEKWLFGSLFTEGCKGDSELDAVKSQVTKFGIDTARRNFESFWSSTMTDQDWSYLANTGNVTTIRLPIGYFTLGPNFCSNTPFEPYSQVYLNAWAQVKAMISCAAKYGIGTLIDLHALPGGANKDAHSGTSSHSADLWGNSANLNLATSCLQFLASECCSLPSVVGLQLVNEAVYNAPGLYQFYDSVISAINPIHPSLPLYISDGWDFSRGLAYSISANKRFLNPVVVDTHKYYCFSDDDKRSSPKQIIEKVNLNEIDAVRGEGAGCVVGEYSCVMDGQSWGNLQDDQRTGIATQFGQKQSQVWQRSCGGSFFWTYKMAWMPGGEWGFKQQTDNNALPAPPHSNTPPDTIGNLLTKATQSRETLKNSAYSEHTTYWNSTSAGESFEHERFATGWDLGFNDALSFFGYRVNHTSGVNRNGGDKIGLLDIWTKRREKQYEASELQNKGTGCNRQYFWEFGHGFVRGVQDFQQAVGL